MNHNLQKALMKWAELSLTTRLPTLEQAIKEDWPDERVLLLIERDGGQVAPGAGRPGDVLGATPAGRTCEICDKAPAVVTVQGETDSFGAEFIECCEACSLSLEEDKRESYHAYNDECLDDDYDD
jgi:hypothetical protein